MGRRNKSGLKGSQSSYHLVKLENPHCPFSFGHAMAHSVCSPLPPNFMDAMHLPILFQFIYEKKKKNQPNNHNNNTIFPIISSLQSFSSGIGNIHEIFCIHLFCGIHMLFVHLDSPK